MTAQDLNLVLNTLYTLGSMGALGAAIAAWKSAHVTKVAAEGQLFSLHFAEYFTPEMLRSLRILRAWKSEMGHEFELKWKKALDAGDQRAHDVDHARRMVVSYFYRALRVYQAGYASQRYVKAVADVDGLNIYYDIVEPLEWALNASYDASQFESLRKLCGRPGTGRLMPPVPLAPSGLAGPGSGQSRDATGGARHGN